MNGTRESCPARLAGLSLAARMTLTLFLALIGSGYLVAAGKIYVWHHDADGEPGMTIDDLRAVYHGIEKTVTAELRQTFVSEMLKQVRPDGAMRRHLEKGGQPAVRTLVAWLEDGAKEETFASPAVYVPGGPSPQAVIRQCCIQCHHAAGGDMEDVPYAENADADPKYEWVARAALPPIRSGGESTQTVRIGPVSTRELIHVTHAHILAIPVFTLIVTALFLLTGLSPRAKLILAPLPMLANCVDFASWWLARHAEPFVYLIAAAGAVFGATLGLQILCVLGSMWFGRQTGQEADRDRVGNPV